MSSYNKVIVVGHLGDDPTIREFDSQVRVADLRLATTEIIQKNGISHEITDWHDVVAWRKLAEFSALYLRKGRKVLVEGKLRNSIWEDKSTGKKRKSTYILASTIRFMDKKDSSVEGVASSPFLQENPELEDEEEVPFTNETLEEELEHFSLNQEPELSSKGAEKRKS